MTLLERLQELRSEHRRNPSPGEPPAITLLRSMLEKASSEGEIATLMTHLGSEYSLYGMNSEAEQVHREMTKRFSEEPLPWISLAGYLLYDKENFGEAKSVIETAIAKAHAKGHFIRHAYHTRARIAKAMKGFPLLEETLRFLVDFCPAPDSEDIDYEDDFLKNLPSGVINAELVERYTQLCQRARK